MLGNCALRDGRYAEAKRAFSTAIIGPPAVACGIIVLSGIHRDTTYTTGNSQLSHYVAVHYNRHFMFLTRVKLPTQFARPLLLSKT